MVDVRVLKRVTHFPALLFVAGHAGVDFYSSFLAVLAPALSERLGISLGEIVTLVGIFTVVTNGIQPLIAYLMNKRGLKWLLWCSLLLATCPAFYGYAPGYWSLAALAVIGAAGIGMYHPEGFLSAHDASGEKAHVGVPVFMAGGFCANAIGAVLATQWSGRLGFSTFGFLALPGIVMALAMFVKYRRSISTHRSAVIRPRKKNEESAPSGFSGLNFLPLFITALCYNSSAVLFTALLPSHYELTFGPESRAWAGGALAVVGLGGSASSFLWGYVAKRYGFYKVMFIVQLLAVPLLVAIAFPSSPAMGFAIAFPLGVFSGNAVFPVAMTAVRHAVGLSQSMRAALMMGGSWTLASFIVMLVGSFVSQGTSSASMMLISAGATLLAALVAAAQLIGKRNR